MERYRQRSQMWITDIQHFLGPDGAFPEGRAGKIGAYLGEIVRAATSQAVGAWGFSEIRCRRRPSHRRCTGWIGVRLTDAPPAVEWECSICGDAGIISGWERTRWDLRQEDGSSS